MRPDNYIRTSSTTVAVYRLISSKLLLIYCFEHSAATKVLYVAIILWSVASSCVRLSILCLYYRLLGQCQSGYKRRYLWVLHGVTAITIGLLLVYVGTGIVPCM